MRQGFIKVAAATPRIRVADPAYNAKAVCEKLREVCQRGAKIAVFPELCLTGYTCGDLFLQQLLLEGAQEALLQVREATEGQDYGCGRAACPPEYFRSDRGSIPDRKCKWR